MYLRDHQGTAPANAQELRTWAEAELDAKELEHMGATSIEDAFVSPRDGQDYVVRPIDPSKMQTVLPRDGSPTGGGGAAHGMSEIIVHEAQGVDGKRWVAIFAGGRGMEVPDDQFRRMVRD
jgi:hypothetical protein